MLALVSINTTVLRCSIIETIAATTNPSARPNCPYIIRHEFVICTVTVQYSILKLRIQYFSLHHRHCVVMYRSIKCKKLPRQLWKNRHIIHMPIFPRYFCWISIAYIGMNSFLPSHCVSVVYNIFVSFINSLASSSFSFTSLAFNWSALYIYLSRTIDTTMIFSWKHIVGSSCCSMSWLLIRSSLSLSLL